MSARDPRKMALQIAGVRASETHLPEDERVFHDPYAELFLPDDMREGLRDLDMVRAAISQYEQMMPGVNGAIVARVRLIDEYLLECIAAGCPPSRPLERGQQEGDQHRNDRDHHKEFDERKGEPGSDPSGACG